MDCVKSHCMSLGCAMLISPCGIYFHFLGYYTKRPSVFLKCHFIKYKPEGWFSVCMQNAREEKTVQSSSVKRKMENLLWVKIKSWSLHGHGCINLRRAIGKLFAFWDYCYYFSSQLLGCLAVFYPGTNQIQPCLAFGRLARLTKCRHLLCFAFRILMSKIFCDCTNCDIWIPVSLELLWCAIGIKEDVVPWVFKNAPSSTAHSLVHIEFL